MQLYILIKPGLHITEACLLNELDICLEPKLGQKFNIINTEYMKKNKSYFTKFLIVFISLNCLATIQSNSQFVSRGYFSPEVHPDKTVTFRFRAPDAKEVKISTQFEKEEKQLVKDENGLWSITLGPVKPDIYPYFFIVDGIQVADPGNLHKFPNERFQSSLVEIQNDSPQPQTLINVPHGTVSYRYYYSEVLGVRPLVVYTPPDYEKNSDKNYPVLYLIHGSSDTEETWTKVGRANVILDNLINQGKAKSMIIVMPYGRAYPKFNFESGSLRDSGNLQEFHKDFIENIVPFVESNYRVIDHPEMRAIAGFSGGGGESLYIGLSHPELFASVCGFAPGMRSEEIEKNNKVPFANPELTNERLKLFWIGCGREDGLYGVIQEYVKILDEKKIEHTTFFTEGGHTWMNCRLYLTEISQLLFK